MSQNFIRFFESLVQSKNQKLSGDSQTFQDFLIAGPGPVNLPRPVQLPEGTFQEI